MRKSALLVIFGALLTSGCSIKTHFLQSDTPIYKSISSSNVRIYALRNPGFKYTVIGAATVEVNGEGQDALQALRERAALMGANAVIDTRLTKFASYTPYTGATGIAVRSK